MTEIVVNGGIFLGFATSALGLITALVTLVVLLVTVRQQNRAIANGTQQSIRAAEASEKNAVHIASMDEKVDGKMDKMLDLTQKVGEARGVAMERDRQSAIDVAALAPGGAAPPTVVAPVNVRSP